MIVLLSKLAYFTMVVGWYGIRLPHMLRARRTPVVVSRRDLKERGLMVVSGAGMGFLPLAYCTVGFGGFAERAAYPAALAAGLLVAGLALALFHGSHRALGRQWSVSLELRRDHALQTGGLYRYVRHPMYAAFWAWCLAQALLLPNWIAGPAGFAGFGCLYLFRVPLEEALMREHFGTAYEDYAARTPRVVPWRWIAAKRM